MIETGSIGSDAGHRRPHQHSKNTQKHKSQRCGSNWHRQPCKATSRFEMNCLIEAFAKAGRPAEVGHSNNSTAHRCFHPIFIRICKPWEIWYITLINSSESTFNPDEHLISETSSPVLFQVPSATQKLVADLPICRTCPVQPFERQHLSVRMR